MSYNVRVKHKVNKIKNFWKTKINLVLENRKNNLLLENKKEEEISLDVLLKKIMLVEGLVTELLAIQLSKETTVQTTNNLEIQQQLVDLKRTFLNNKSKPVRNNNKKITSKEVDSYDDDLSTTTS